LACGLARLARKRAVRGGAMPFAAQGAERGSAPGARCRAAVDLRGRSTPAGPLAFRRQVHAGAAGFRQADGDRLLRRAGAVSSLADVLDLLADEFARDGAGGLTGARFSPRALEGAFFGHEKVSFRRVS